MIEYIRPYTPDFAGWLTKFGQGASNYDAHGHFARIQPMFNAFSLTSTPLLGEVLTPTQDATRLEGLETTQSFRCPGGATQPPPDGSAPWRPTGASTATPRPCRRAHEADLRHSGREASAAAALVLGVGASDDSGAGYEVRAIFDNVSGAVEGEDVKIAGARVGAIKELDVTADKKAVVVLEIEEPGFAPFRDDAKCTIRPQSLIGEKFVECDPGRSDQPELEEVPDGEEGEGQAMLPLERTSSPVDLDLINDIMRLPYRERLAILINEFGTALAGRGAELNEVIHRANPALRETDEVLKILAGQNRTLAQLAATATRRSARWRASARTWGTSSSRRTRRRRRRPSGGASSRRPSRSCRASSRS